MSKEPEFLVRPLGCGDEALFRQLLEMFGAAFEDRETYTALPPGKPYVDSLLARDEFIALVALHDGTVVGGLTAYVLTKPERERSEVYIYDLAVAAACRRKGIATALIERLKPIARSCGAGVIFVQADLVDAPAIALYSKLGRREDVLHFDISLD